MSQRALVVELAVGERAFISERGEVTLAINGRSMTLRKREIQKLIREYQREMSRLVKEHA